MEAEIPKVYPPESIEPRWARFWVDRKLYRPGDNASRPRFCLVIPPPNITGSLHMGHMLEHTEIDVLMRWRRMQSSDVLWLPGTDHASIATQMIVERELGREALPSLDPGPEAMAAWQREGQRLRLQMGREQFVARCWKWKEVNGGTIRRQMERLGASCDWTRERFTMDPAYSMAVNEAFVRLHDEQLIYHDWGMVNWCPRCRTALSDLEVAHEERQGKLWFIRYPFEDGTGSVTVATTRPETMLGDTAVAIHPRDGRYAGIAGKRVTVPLTGRAIPVIEDEFVDPAFGTGAVKVTPAHDPNDFAMGQRYKLERIAVIDGEARMTPAAGAYAGQDRFEARANVLRDLKSQGLIEKVEDHVLSAGVCQRCKTVVEPLLSRQWFMKMKPLATPAIKAVEDGQIKILPESGQKKYLNWMENIHDWCISRQLWWGHRIPVWYCDACGAVMAVRETPSRCLQCDSRILRAETDVLDTWFSSALWPFATLGWPDENAPDVKRFYPNDIMIMGEDILFFWGARMVMMGMKLMGDVPFRELYIHALVRDAERQKMSKTKGNVLDPLEVTDKYGTDAVRFALAISAAPGTDIAFSNDKIESYRSFANKVWNAARFILMNLERLPEPARRQIAMLREPADGVDYAAVVASTPGAPDVARPGESRPALADRWIFSRLAAVTREMDRELAAYRFHEAASRIYHFFWHEFCDWYLEWVKPELSVAPQEARPSAAWTNLIRAFEASLHLLHPFMPFITEELWHQLPGVSAQSSLSLQRFGLVSGFAEDPVSERQFEAIQELVLGVRNAKHERGLQREKPGAQVASSDARLLELFRQHQEPILRLAGLEAINFKRGRLSAELDRIAVSASVDLRIFHETRVDESAERERLRKERDRIQQSILQAEVQLHNERFLSRAPREVVRGVEQRHAELSLHLQKVLESLDRLGEAG